MTEFQNVKIPRDRWGRPMVLPLGARKDAKRVAYRRTTTFVGCLDDQNGLMKWKNRHVAYGMGQRKDLVLAAAAANPDDKTKLGDIADKAFEHSKGMAGDAAETGTALHSFTERIDRGETIGTVPTEYQADLDAYRRATDGINWVGIENFRINDDWKVAGTADRLARIPNFWADHITVCDIKTGSIDYPHKMAMQLAMYARMVAYDIATDTRVKDPGEVNLNWGVIIHLPAGKGECTLYKIDLIKGWGACQIAKQVWSWRDTKGLAEVLKLGEPKRPATWESLITNARSIDDLRAIWEQARECGELTPELKGLAKTRSQELAA